MDPRNPKWEQAACNGYDWELFFPEGDNFKVDARAAAKAKTICLTGNNGQPCPIYWDCLQDAMNHHQQPGIYAATTQRERRELAKKMREKGITNVRDLKLL